MIFVHLAWAWLKLAVRWFLALFGIGSKPQRRSPKLPPGARFIPYNGQRVNPLRRLRKALGKVYPYLLSGRQWVKFRKRQQRSGIDLMRLARLVPGVR